MSQQRDVIEQKGPNQIVRIRSDSETNLDELFKAVIHPKDGSTVPHSVPMRMRNLPPSFFKQPDRGSKSASHSRESSTDGTYTAPPPPQTQQRGLAINHPRAHSSPATLQQTYTSTRPTTSPPQHIRQQSFDISDDTPLPPGWEMAKTSSGQRYFLNHITQTTTWNDPRSKTGNLHSPVSHAPTVSSPAPPISSRSPTSQASSINMHNLGPLPEGWDQATTSEGEIYFINHTERTTSWLDPRLPDHMQRQIVLNRGLPSHPLQGVTQAQSSTSSSITAQLSSHNSVAAGIVPPVPSAGNSNNQQIALQMQQKLRLHKLQAERERLRVRQQEILRQNPLPGIPMINQFKNPIVFQEAALRRSLGEDMIIPTSPPGSNTELAPTNTTTTGIDPFLGGNDFHSRQESADSGLGLGPNYSHPHTPEDFLMEDNEDPGNDDVAQQNDLGFDSLQSSNLDLGAENMDSDDLVPSLQEELNADILSDVEALLNSSNKECVLTWL